MANSSLTEMKELLEKVGVKFEINPSETRLLELDVSSWPIYFAEASEKIPACFEFKETMYMLDGKVTISCQGVDGSFEIEAGILIAFPKGMNITWHVTLKPLRNTFWLRKMSNQFINVGSLLHI